MRVAPECFPAPAERRGFTLLETVLAVSLSVLLIGLVAAGMRIYTQVISDRRADVVNAQVARVVMQNVANDLQSAYYPVEEESGSPAGGDSLDDGTEGVGGDELGGGGEGVDAGDDTTGTSDTEVDATADLATSVVQPTPGLYGNATEMQVDIFGQFANPLKYDLLTAKGVEPMSANLLSEPKVVTYYLRTADETELAGTPLEAVNGEGGQRMVFVRRVQSRSQAVFDATASAGAANLGTPTGEILLSDQVIDAQFLYHDGYDWLDTWDSSIVGGLPIAVSVTLTIVDEGTDLDDTEAMQSTYQRTIRIPTAEFISQEEDTAMEGL